MKKFLLLLLVTTAAFAADSKDPFGYLGQNTVSISATTSSASVALPTACVNAIAAGSAPQFQWYNSGTVPVFVRGGDVSVVATVPSGSTGGSYPVAPGAVVVITWANSNPTYVAAITASGSATVYGTCGTGQ